MKFENLRIPPASPPPVNRNPYVGPLKSEAQNPERAPALPLRPIPAGEGGRGSQRVLLRVSANIHVVLSGKSETLEVTTLSVSPHGAMIVMKQRLPAETRFELEHRATNQRVTCKVVRLAQKMPEGFHVAVEFDAPTPDFWGIAFPPLDWRPDDL